MENTENQEVMNQTEETPSSWSFVDEAQVAAAQGVEQPTQESPAQEQAPIQEQAPVEQQTQFNATTDDFSAVSDDNTYGDDDLEGAVLDYLSERLGTEFSSFDDFARTPEPSGVVDERIAAIAQFVEETGRAPQDWFVYQQMNPSEMDDLTAIQVQMTTQYPNLSSEEISTLLTSKYKIDPDVNSEDEVRLATLQLKMDAEAARSTIEEIREAYAAPDVSEVDTELFDEAWYNDMYEDTDDYEGVEFDLGNGQAFKFGVGDSYRQSLADRNTRLDEYFDPYVREDGSWDYDTLNMHRTVLDNMDDIVRSVYQQGLSDGKRGLVNQAANVNIGSPNQGNMVPTGDPLSKQLNEILGGQGGMKFL